MSELAPNGRTGASTPNDPDAETWVVEVSGSSRGKFIRARLPITSFGAPDIEVLEDGSPGYRDPFARHISGGTAATSKATPTPLDADSSLRTSRPLPAVREEPKKDERNWLGLGAAALAGAAVVGGIFLISQLSGGDDDNPATAENTPASPLVSGTPVGLASFADLGETCRVKFDRAVLGPPPLTRLQNLGLSLAVLRPAISTAQAQYALPVRASDNVICGELGGTIGLRGGIAITNGKDTLELRRLRIDGESGLIRTTSSGAVAGTDRISIDLEKGRWVQKSDYVTYRVPVELTDAGADDLNSTMDLTDFAGGDSIGVLSLTGEARVVIEEANGDTASGG